jgi:hypothetical protein
MWPFTKKEEDIVDRARQITEVLSALQIDKFSEVGKDIRKVVALELLGEQHPQLKNINKAAFVQGITREDIEKAQYMKSFVDDLKDRGLLKGDNSNRAKLTKK